MRVLRDGLALSSPDVWDAGLHFFFDPRLIKKLTITYTQTPEQ